MISKYASPRSDDRIDGWPGANIDESEITTASAARRFAFAAMKSLEVLAADFLFPFREHDHVHGQLAANGQVRLERLHVEKELSFVIHRPARVDAPIANRRLERR